MAATKLSVEVDETDEEYQQFAKLGHKVIKNYNKYIAKSDDALTPCILVATGTFSPIHYQHVVNMELSKQTVEANNKKCRVVGGFISPTHDSYCSYKLEDLAIPAVHRNKMISLALQDNDWIEVSPWHTEQEYMQSINAEVEHIERMVQTLYAANDEYQKFVIFYVCGSDLGKRGFRDGFQPYGVCIIQRESDPMRNYNKYVKPPIYLIDIPKEYDEIKNVSSTQIRMHIQHGKLINHLTFESVQAYMVENDILGASKLKYALEQSKPKHEESEEEKENANENEKNPSNEANADSNNANPQ